MECLGGSGVGGLSEQWNLCMAEKLKENGDAGGNLSFLSIVLGLILPVESSGLGANAMRISMIKGFFFVFCFYCLLRTYLTFFLFFLFWGAVDMFY